MEHLRKTDNNRAVINFKYEHIKPVSFPIKNAEELRSISANRECSKSLQYDLQFAEGEKVYHLLIEKDAVACITAVYDKPEPKESKDSKSEAKETF